MWTLIRFFVCSGCGEVHLHLIDNVPDKQGVTLATCDYLIGERDHRFSPQQPCYEIVHPNHMHAVEIRRKCPEACSMWDEVLAAKLAAHDQLTERGRAKHAFLAATPAPDRGNMVRIEPDKWFLTLATEDVGGHGHRVRHHATLRDGHFISDRD